MRGRSSYLNVDSLSVPSVDASSIAANVRYSLDEPAHINFCLAGYEGSRLPQGKQLLHEN
jgi:hypothetical protein